jgi:hypothetical protein
MAKTRKIRNFKRTHPELQRSAKGWGRREGQADGKGKGCG